MEGFELLIKYPTQATEYAGSVLLNFTSENVLRIT